MEGQSTVLNRLITTVDNCIKDAVAAHLSETAALLRMAKIDLIIRANGINEEDMDVFMFMVESGLRLAEYINPPELLGQHKAAGAAS
ncbi:MAG: hypothetical protein KGJ49_12130 [Alphaproteobacteria bacterium]|nr:hypothetical protein [Alphaproteobacteria bacterium]